MAVVSRVRPSDVQGAAVLWGRRWDLPPDSISHLLQQPIGVVLQIIQRGNLQNTRGPRSPPDPQGSEITFRSRMMRALRWWDCAEAPPDPEYALPELPGGMIGSRYLPNGAAYWEQFRPMPPGGAPSILPTYAEDPLLPPAVVLALPAAAPAPTVEEEPP